MEAMLLQRDYQRLVELCQARKPAWKALYSKIYEVDERLSWPAVEAMAMVMRQWWGEGGEAKVREYIRRLFWALNDESGGIGWNAPQTIAETIVLIPELIDPYGSMMIDRTIEEKLLVQGGLWGTGRLGNRIIKAVDFFQERILSVFRGNDPQTLGLAAWAMGEVGFEKALIHLTSLRGRTEPARIYIEGEFHSKPVGQWAREAEYKIQ